jgi:uncharacterized Zn finger protein
MALKQGLCPSCEKHVEWTAVHSGGSILYRCNNCWHVMDGDAVKKLEELNTKLAKIEETRNATLATYR